MNYTILEALKEINRTMPINLDMLKSINGEGVNFTLHFITGEIYEVDLDNHTYFIQKN